MTIYINIWRLGKKMYQFEEEVHFDIESAYDSYECCLDSVTSDPLTYLYTLRYEPGLGEGEEIDIKEEMQELLAGEQKRLTWM